MRVAQGVHQLARSVARHLRHHRQQQRVGGDVEGHAEEDVGAALVELQRQPAPGIAGGGSTDPELEEHVAGRERHRRQLADVPRRHQVTPRVGVAADARDHRCQLIDGATAGGGPGTPLAPVDRPQLTARVGPLVPDGHPVRLQRADVGVAGEEPEQLVDDRPGVHPLGGEEGEARREVEPHLPAEGRERAGAGAVLLLDAVREDVTEQVEVLLHRSGSQPRWRGRPATAAAPLAARGAASTAVTAGPRGLAPLGGGLGASASSASHGKKRARCSGDGSGQLSYLPNHR